MTITEQFILMTAPNASAAANGRKLSREGRFSAHGSSSEGNVFWANCAGSGKNGYRTSVDFSNGEAAPVCRCSCPSRQFPCKHGVGLLYEILAGKAFPVGPVPEDLARKMEKRAAKAEKKEKDASTAEKAKKTNTAAQKKKILKQLEGLDLVEKLIDDLLTSGVGTLAGTSASGYLKIAQDLGNYYLTGPQNAFTRMALEIRKIQKAPEQAREHYAAAMQILISLHATVKKGRAYLNEKLESGNYASEDTVLFEAMGGVWRLEDLKRIGSFRENARLIQLSFDVSYDEAKGEFVDRGFWIDMDTGAIDHTVNFRPLKALKYVKAEDSCFELVEVPVLYEYPGDRNKRIRWEGCTTAPITVQDYARLPKLAESIATAVKIAKNQMKNTMAPKYMPVLLPAAGLGLSADGPVLTDPEGSRILLRDRKQEGADHGSVEMLKSLPGAIGPGSAVFGLLFYDPEDNRICLHPYSVVMPDRIIRLCW